MYRREFQETYQNTRQPSTFLSDISPCYIPKSLCPSHEFVSKMYVFNSKYRNKPNNSHHPSDMITEYSNTNTTSYIQPNKTSGSTNNFELELFSPIRNVVKMIFKSIEFYNSIYAIHEKNNYFYICYHNKIYKIKLPIGNVNQENYI